MRHESYRSLLLDELETRQRTRPQLSMNAFARHLRLTGGHFSDLIHRRKGLSEAKALEIADKLRLPRQDREFFVLSVRAEHARGSKQREQAQRDLEVVKSQKITILQNEFFRLISQWHHLAILELTRLDDFQPDIGWIANRLGLPKTTVESAVERLKKLRLLRESGGVWAVHDGLLRTTDDVPSLAIKSHHTQALNMASRAIHEQDVEQREFSTLMMAIDKKKLPLAKERIRAFQREMSVLLTGSASSRDEVYFLATQLFAITHVNKKGH